MILEMKVFTLQIIFLAFVILWEEGQIYVNSMDSEKLSVLKGGVSEEVTDNIAVSEDVQNISPEVEKYIVENQSDIMVQNDKINLEIKKNYIAHHRGNRRYLIDEYNKELSESSGGNHNFKKANDYSIVDETSKQHLDSNIISNTLSRETTKHHVKEEVIEENNSLNTVEVQNHIFDTGDNFVGLDDNMEVPIKQSINSEENHVGITEESHDYDNVIDDEEENDDKAEDDGESYVLPDVEDFWDAVDTFINIHSEPPEREGPQESEDLYEYLYTPSGNSPGIDQFLDLLLFVKDIGDSVERIGEDAKWTGEKDNVYENTETSPMELSENHEINEIMGKKEDNYTPHVEYEIYKDTKKINKSRSNRSKRSDKNYHDEVSRNISNDEIVIQHESYVSTFGMTFPILRFDLFFQSLEFEPFMEPFSADP